MVNRRVSYLLITPALVILLVIAVYPLVRAVLLSFFATEYGFSGAEFVGLDNYRELLGGRFFNRAVRNTVVFTLLATAGEVGLGLVLALICNRVFPGRRLIIPILLTPYVLATMVVTAIWTAWYHYDFGFINNFIRAVGLSPVEWLSNPKLALNSLVLVDIWQTAPFAFIIILAGLQSIPGDIYEAARVDGVSRWRVFTGLTLPLLQPYILLAALIRSLDSFKIFDKVYTMTGGGPGQATETLSMYVYRLGFRFFDVGLASAAAVIMILIAGALSSVYVVRLMRESR